MGGSEVYQVGGSEVYQVGGSEVYQVGGSVVLTAGRERSSKGDDMQRGGGRGKGGDGSPGPSI